MSVDRLRLAVVDTSALFAILDGEPSAGAFQDGLARCDDLRMSAGTHLELSIVVRGKKGIEGLQVLDRLIAALGIVVDPFAEPPHALLGRHGAIHYGKGFHTAALNYGDLFSYATAKSLDAPIYFQGFDFARTDARDAMKELGFKFDAYHRPR